MILLKQLLTFQQFYIIVYVKLPQNLHQLTTEQLIAHLDRDTDLRSLRAQYFQTRASMHNILYLNMLNCSLI